MKVPDMVRQGVVFLGHYRAGAFVPRATAFIATWMVDRYHFPHLITAGHCVDMLYRRDEVVCVRLNREGGGADELEVPREHWFFHPGQGSEQSVDVAVLPMRLDRKVHVFAQVPLDHVAATPTIISRHNIGIGDEVFVAGLFSAHAGEERNVPIVRIGNLAAMPEEPVRTRLGSMDAYLIELRSIGGLSGSPVFVHRAPVFVDDHGKVKFASSGLPFYLLGLIHGHFDVANLNEDVVSEDASGGLGNINTGIGIVVPAVRILEVVMHPELVKHRQRIVDQIKAGGS